MSASWLEWIEIIAKIIILIGTGMSKEDAANKLAAEYDVSPSEILKRL